ncbi:hypothetical protein NL108_008810, partial [Boleophthalmus pectinirostris]
GNTCLENGSYLMNYQGCANCHHRDFVLISNKSTEDEDGEEIVTYDHVCKNCEHVIARHEYTFSVVEEYQVKVFFSSTLCSMQDSRVTVSVCRSTPCCVCCVGKQRTPSVCCQTTPGNLPFSKPAKETSNIYEPF